MKEKTPRYAAFFLPVIQAQKKGGYSALFLISRLFTGHAAL
jgi:hypothetical protein